MTTTWPKGPNKLADLFDWHNFNARTLLTDDFLKSNFLAFLHDYDQIVVHEDYAGTGNAGASLVMQFRAMKRLVAPDLAPGDLDMCTD